MADMKTTQERRDRFREWLHDDTRDHLSIRAWCVAEDACDDVDTLLAELARLAAPGEGSEGGPWRTSAVGTLKTTAEERATVRGAVGAWQHDDALAAMAALDDLDTLLAENARLRAAEAEVERLRGALRNVRDNYDCDESAHKYGTTCRCCDARAALGEP